MSNTMTRALELMQIVAETTIPRSRQCGKDDGALYVQDTISETLLMLCKALAHAQGMSYKEALFARVLV